VVTRRTRGHAGRV
jgi:hypothetical protein